MKFKDFFAKDGSSDEPVRAYKVEESHEIGTISGPQTVGDGYVIARDRPELVDHVPTDVFEANYGPRQAASGDVESPSVVEPGDAGYDPSDKTQTDVLAYLKEHPEQAKFVVEREQDGQNRPKITAVPTE